MTEPTTDVLLAKKRLAFKIAEVIDEQLDRGIAWDLDLATEWIYLIMPDSRAEYEAELAEFKDPVPNIKPKGESPFKRLRQAMGMEKASLTELIEAAIDMATTVKATP